MVHELHRRGYQRLRIVPGVQLAWRLGVTPASNTLPEHGAMARSFDWDRLPQYTSAAQYDYFEKKWGLGPRSHPARIADRFLEAFPHIALEGVGIDLPYAGWLTMVLGLAAQGAFPIAFGEYYGVVDDLWLRTTTDLLIPMPPATEK